MLFKNVLLLHQYKNYADSLQDFLVLLFSILSSCAELFDVLVESERHLEFFRIDPLFKGKP